MSVSCPAIFSNITESLLSNINALKSRSISEIVQAHRVKLDAAAKHHTGQHAHSRHEAARNCHDAKDVIRDFLTELDGGLSFDTACNTYTDTIGRYINLHKVYNDGELCDSTIVSDTFYCVSNGATVKELNLNYCGAGWSDSNDEIITKYADSIILNME